MLDHNTCTTGDRIILVNDKKIAKPHRQRETTVGSKRHGLFNVRDAVEFTFQYFSGIKYTSDDIRNEPTVNTVRLGNLRYKYCLCFRINLFGRKRPAAARESGLSRQNNEESGKNPTHHRSLTIK